MKTIGYIDLGDGNKTMMFYSLPLKSKNERIAEALENLKHTGNIAVYFLKGSTQRLLLTRKL